MRRRKLKKISIVICILIIFFLLAGLIYSMKIWCPFKENFEEINTKIDTYTENQGNYLAICQENGLKQFPFICGSRVNILSISDGKIHTVIDTKRFLDGFISPAMMGEDIYYFDAWDGESEGNLFVKNIRDSSKPKKLEDDVRQYTLKGNDLFYVKGNDFNLYYKNLKTQKEERLIVTGGNWQYYYLSIKGNTLYFADNLEGVLYVMNLKTRKVKEHFILGELKEWLMDVQPISSHEILIATSQHGILEYDMKDRTYCSIAELGGMRQIFDNNRDQYEFYYAGNRLYFYDQKFATYEFNLDTRQKRSLINWKNVEVVKDYIHAPDNLSMRFFYCPDFIVAEVEYYNEKSDDYEQRIAAFDYDGKLTLNKKI